MDKEIKARWVAALRSGQYKQTQERLHDSRGHCCLGVLCDLYAKEHGVKWEGELLPSDAMRLRGLGGSCYPAPEVREWADFHEDKQQVQIGGLLRSVAVHNDAGRTFAEIADAIEAQL